MRGEWQATVFYFCALVTDFYQMRNLWRTLATSCLIFVSTEHTASGQEAAGIVRNARTQDPEPHVSIVLVNTRGTIVAGTITGEDGRFHVKAPDMGRFRIRVRKLGFSPDSSPQLIFGKGESVEFNASLNALPYNLESVAVEGESRCGAGKGREGLFSLWEVVQNALTATVATSYANRVSFRLRQFQRQVDAASGSVIRSSTREVYALNTEPYYSVSPDSLANAGFARRERDSTTYFAPDARTLTSEAFSNSHCFRAVRDVTRPGDIGLGFRPSKSSELVDVSGVLWLDAKSASLKELDYTYDRPGISNAEALAAVTPGGHIEYRRLAGGAWIVDKWVIRVPTQMERVSAGIVGSSLNGQTGIRSPSGTRPVILWEVGGEVQDVLAGSSVATDSGVRNGSLHGTLAAPDSIALKGKVVAILTNRTADSPLRETTVTNGYFAFDGVPEGDYVVQVTSPILDTLNLTVSPTPVRISGGEQQTMTIRLPSVAEGRAALCGRAQPRSAILHGYVRDSATHRPISGARVQAYWLAAVTRIGPTGGGLSAAPHELVTTTDANGRFVFCGLEATNRLVLSASIGNFKGRLPTLSVVADKIAMADLIIRR
ncbi:MAG TPA: carboxypeptidase-like regulatory domain-containing protein [Gemmatimonadaceae bacterium]|nr:carboxypeptidase-like regulatory domain-containing protein [Gemmatimonadaceae bacterium]